MAWQDQMQALSAAIAANGPQGTGMPPYGQPPQGMFTPSPQPFAPTGVLPTADPRLIDPRRQQEEDRRQQEEQRRYLEEVRVRGVGAPPPAPGMGPPPGFVPNSGGIGDLRRQQEEQRRMEDEQRRYLEEERRRQAEGVRVAAPPAPPRPY